MNFIHITELEHFLCIMDEIIVNIILSLMNDVIGLRIVQYLLCEGLAVLSPMC